MASSVLCFSCSDGDLDITSDQAVSMIFAEAGVVVLESPHSV